MKILLYVLILTAVLFVPVKGSDVGKLIPVEVAAVSEQSGLYTIRTDTGDAGAGDTLDAAFENLEKTAPGTIYLNTVECLLVEEGLDLDLFKPYLKGTVRVYRAEEGIALDGIADFLSVRKPGIKLNEVQNMVQIPSITEENGRYQVHEK